MKYLDIDFAAAKVKSGDEKNNLRRTPGVHKSSNSFTWHSTLSNMLNYSK